MSNRGGVQRRGRYWGTVAPDTYDEPDSIPSLDGGWVRAVSKGSEKDDEDAQVRQPGKKSVQPVPITKKARSVDSNQSDSHAAESDTVDSDLLIEIEIDALKAARKKQEQGSAEAEELSVKEDIAPVASGDQTVDDNLMASTVKQIVATLKQNFEDDKVKYRQAMQLALRHRISQLEKKANVQLRRKLHQARKKDRALIEQKEQRLISLVGQLETLVKQVAVQKQKVEKVSREFEQKLAESDLVQNELHQAGRTLSEQAKALGDALVDDRASAAEIPDRDRSTRRDSNDADA